MRCADGIEALAALSQRVDQRLPAARPLDQQHDGDGHDRQRCADDPGRLREHRGDRARPRDEVEHARRRDRGEPSARCGSALQGGQRSARLEQVVGEMRQAAEELARLGDEGHGSRCRDGRDDRHRGEGDQARAQPAGDAVPLQPAHRRFDRHGEHDPDEQPDKDPAQIPDQEQKQGAARDDSHDDRRSPSYLRGAEASPGIVGFRRTACSRQPHLRSPPSCLSPPPVPLFASGDPNPGGSSSPRARR